MALINVLDYGATGDGTTDDTAAVQAALAACSNGDILYFPMGTYAVEQTAGTVLGTGASRRRLTILGDGRHASILKVTGATTTLISAHGGASQLTIEGLGFDGDNFIFFHIYSQGSTTVRDCRFTGFDDGYGVFLQSAVRIKIEDCEFVSEFDSQDRTSHGIFLTGGCQDITIKDCIFRWLYDCILVDSDDVGATQRIVISGCTFDNGWWILPTRVNGESYLRGTPDTWTNNTLVKADAGFPAIPLYTTVRALRPSVTGTVSGSYPTLLNASTSVGFHTAGLYPGDLVFIENNGFGVITATPDTDTVCVEEWLDRDNLTPVNPPSGGSTFTAYKLGLGRVAAANSTTITVDRWHDIRGTILTGASLVSASATYEICVDIPNYPLHNETGEDVRVVNNTFRRGWSDQCSIWGKRQMIVANTIEHGQDMGITVNGSPSLAVANSIRHQGLGGLFSISDGLLVIGNLFATTPWISDIDDYGGHVIMGPEEAGLTPPQVLAFNHLDGENFPQNRYGATWSSPRAMVIGNVARRFLNNPFQSYGTGARAYVIGNELDGGTIKHAAGATVAQYSLFGTAAPPPGLVVAVGSTYTRTNGTAGETWVYTTPGWRKKVGVE